MAVFASAPVAIPVGPSQSLHAAVARATELTRNGRSVVVQLGAGVHRIERPVAMSSPAGSLVLEPSPGAEATISGFRKVENWRVEGRKWVAVLPPNLNPTQLFADGVRRLRPRVPKVGYGQIEATVEPLPENKGRGNDGFIYPAGTLDPAWQNQEDIEVLGWLDWSIVRGRIRNIDSATRTLRLRKPTEINDGWALFKPGYRFLVENVKEALDEPGEWYFDRPTHTLTYLPIAGEDPERTVVEIPVAPRLFQVGDAGPESRDITLRKLTLEGTTTETPADGRFFYQAEADLDGAVLAENVQHFRIEHCTIRRTGEYAVKLGQGVMHSEVVHCTLYDLGAGGVMIGQTARLDGPNVTAGCLVESNAILGYGRVHPAGVGLWIGQNANNTLRGNWIEDGYYSGISAGWSWGYAPSGSHHNLIENNTITRIGQRVLSDMGGIYTLSPSPGTVIRGNRISDVESFSYGGWGIYPDEGSTDILVENNVTWNTKSEGFHCHYGRDNVVRNNVFALGRLGLVQRSRQEEHNSVTLSGNILYGSVEQAVGTGYAGVPWEGAKYERNLWWRVGGGELKFGGLSFAEWQAKGQDAGSRFADPLFRDPSAGDFRLREGSPALGMGFKPFARLAPDTRPSRLPASVLGTFPIPAE